MGSCTAGPKVQGSPRIERGYPMNTETNPNNTGRAPNMPDEAGAPGAADFKSAAQADATPKVARKSGRFQANRKYFTICIYGIITFCVCLLIFKFTNNWQATRARISEVFSMLTPFLIAFLIAYFINPLIRRIDRVLDRLLRGRLISVHRLLSLILAYIVLIGFIALVLTFVIPQIGASILELIRQAPSMYTGVENGLNDFIREHPNMNLEAIQQFVNENLPNMFEYVQGIMSSVVPMIYNAGLSIISWIINIVLAFVISCYLMWDKANLLRAIKRVIYALFSQQTARKIIDIIKKCNEIFSAYIIGKAIDSLIIGILCFVLMCLLQIPYAVLISVIVGITNMIPYFGPFIGAVPGGIILLIISPQKALIFVIMIFVLQQFDGSILGPKILGDSTGLQPIWIIFAITVGGYAAGVVGMFLGVPITAVIAYLLNTLVEFFLRKRQLPPEVTATLEALPDKPETPKVPFSERIKKWHKK